MSYIDIHIIQSLPTSNINRGEDGAPKSIMYGGVNRSRVSSQSWKSATRKYFGEHFAPENQGFRTLDLIQAFVDVLGLSDSDRDKAKNYVEVLAKQGLFKIKDEKIAALFFISTNQIKELAKAIDEGAEKKKLKEILKANQSYDISAFGRMSATDTDLNVDASVQVADAISVHEVKPQVDFYTAVDDLGKGQGSSMLGYQGIVAPTLYRYANINIEALRENLQASQGETNNIIINFVKAFILSMPTGKQNTFANRTLPSYIRIDVRDDMPVSAVNAYLNPIKKDYINNSIKSLEDELDYALKMGNKPLYSGVLSRTNGSSLEMLVDTLKSYIEK